VEEILLSDTDVEALKWCLDLAIRQTYNLDTERYRSNLEQILARLPPYGTS